MATVEEKRTAYRALHESGCFVQPNPWDLGSARFLQTMFPALASTSSGFAWSRGRPDNGMPLSAVLAHLKELVEATDVPLNADFENGFGATPVEVGENVGLCIATGVAGLSIEDSTGHPEAPLFDLGIGVARMKAARKAIDDAGGSVMLTGRAEGFIAGRPDMDDVIARLKAYSEAGADCLYAPGIRTEEQITTIVKAVAPKPVNVLVGAAGDLTVPGLAAMGVRRVSVGGGLARVGWVAFANAAKVIAEEGSFAGFATTVPSPFNPQAFFREDARSQQ